MMNSTLRKMISIGAYWNYNISNKRYHAELTSGLHSNEFFNFGKLNNAQDILNIITNSPVYDDLIKLKNIESVDCVCGQAYGSISIAVVLSHLIDVPFIFTEKDSNGEMCLSRYKDTAKDYFSILMIEDVCTTLKTTKKSIDCIGLEKISGIFTIINRTGSNSITIDDTKLPIYSCADVDTTQYTKDECPLCNEGSIALRPKKDNNWSLLTNVS